MPDEFASHQPGLSSPGTRIYLITPSALTPLDPLPRAIRCDSAGSITVRTVGSEDDVVLQMGTGEILPLRVEYVTAATGTYHAIC